MKSKLINILKNVRKKIAQYLSTNRLVLTFIIFALIETVLIRNYTVKDTFNIEPFICDLGLLIVISAFGYLFKPKKQFGYFFTWLIIITIMCVINSIYYVFYTSYASFSLIAELGLVGEVGDSLIEKFRVIDFIYILFPFMYFLLHRSLKKGTYYQFVSKIEKSKKMFASTILVGVIVLVFTIVNISGADASRLVKQWNRELIVKRFGIVLYQANDLVQSLIPKFHSLFGYDEAAKNFKDYYAKKFEEPEPKSNEYTGALEGMNVIFIHMESIHNYLVNMKVNEQEITPTINRLSKEGMYFDNFYPQISTGTSSDTEFTLNTSLMPVSSGTAFVSYYKRNYVTIPKLLSDMGYYTFSSHGNGPTMWNRNNMHPRLGYQEMIFKDKFDIGDESDPRWVGLGISDYDYFLQLQPMLEQIEQEHELYMGTLIQLSNHSPYAKTDSNPELYNYFGKLTLTNTYKVVDEKTGETEEKTDDYLKGKELGDYLISAHYADMALGTFFDYVRNSEYYNNTVFVLYGDHDARLAKEDYQYYYNYDVKTGIVRSKGDEGYVEFDNISYELNKKTPLIIWTKNPEVAKKINIKNSNVIGMYDIMPTIGNMMGFRNKFALGHDIYDIKENNIVIFPNGNFITNKVYYSNTNSSSRILYHKDKNGNDIINVDIEENYIEDYKKYVEELLDVSNDIIIHDLIYKEGDNIPIKNKENEVANG